MKPLTSRQWRIIGNWATFAGFWNIAFGCWFGYRENGPAFAASLLFLAISLWILVNAMRREDAILRSLVYYGGERIVRVAVRDYLGLVWSFPNANTWEAAQEAFTEEVGKDSSLNLEYGYRTTHRTFVTPEEAAFIARYSRQIIPWPRSGYGLEPSELAGAGFRP